MARHRLFVFAMVAIGTLAACDILTGVEDVRYWVGDGDADPDPTRTDDGAPAADPDAHDATIMTDAAGDGDADATLNAAADAAGDGDADATLDAAADAAGDGDADATIDADAASDADPTPDADADPADEDGALFDATALSAGEAHTCALSATGGAACWGLNAQGQLGDGTQTKRAAPVVPTGLPPGLLAIGAGGQHTCALTADGGVMCWGDDAAGELGDNMTTSRSTPAFVNTLTSGVSAIAVGGNHTCALTTAGAVLCWGDNSNAQLGNNSMLSSSTPGPVSGLAANVTAISAGFWHTCALLRSGGLSCWGRNVDGELGNGTTTPSLTPVTVSGLPSGVVGIVSGGVFTCAVTDAGAVVCWGGNDHGEIGDGTRMARSVPTPATGLGSGVVGLAAGDAHACAVVSSGAVFCWGFNTYGTVGNDGGSDAWQPTPVVGLTSGAGVVALTGGGAHTCALFDTGGIRCWGLNTSGQLGDGTNVDQHTPGALVTFP
jgi:alpha-tubulin suppressor-like RCC1 family protein